MDKNIAVRLYLHRKFWSGQDLARPLIAFKVGNGFFNSQFKAARHLFVHGKRIMPDMIDIDSFLEEYEEMFRESCLTGQDAFWTAEPFSAIPWMEAILGCEIYGTEYSLVSHPWVKSMDGLEKVSFDMDNPWFAKSMEFIFKLDRLAAGRFPIGQPLMRGPSDVAGALMGQTELVCALYDYPEEMRKLFLKISDIFLKIISHYYGKIPIFHEGHSIGMYHLWAPDKIIWYQEDVSALLSPLLYNKFLKDPDANICMKYDFSLMHIHPASFFILDEVLKIDRLKVIEINKDVEGPSVKEMMPVFRKILLKKNLLVSGELNKEDIQCILEELPSRGVFLHIIVPSLEHAQFLMEYIIGKKQ